MAELNLSSLSNRFSVQVDPRGRISFPANYRAQIGDTLYISPDVRYRHFLVVRSPEGYHAYLQEIINEGIENGYTSEEIEDDVRDFAMMTAQVSPDKNGRITLTQQLIEYAELTSGKAYVVGIGDHAEIWDSVRMEAYEKERAAEKAARRRQRDAEKAARIAGKGVDG